MWVPALLLDLTCHVCLKDDHEVCDAPCKYVLLPRILRCKARVAIPATSPFNTRSIYQEGFHWCLDPSEFHFGIGLGGKRDLGLGSRAGHSESLDSSVDSQGVQIYLYTLESTLESRLSGWPALEPRPRSLLPPNPMPKWNTGGARHQLNPFQCMLLVSKRVLLY